MVRKHLAPGLTTLRLAKTCAHQAPPRVLYTRARLWLSPPVRWPPKASASGYASQEAMPGFAKNVQPQCLFQACALVFLGKQRTPEPGPEMRCWSRCAPAQSGMLQAWSAGRRPKANNTLRPSAVAVLRRVAARGLMLATCVRTAPLARLSFLRTQKKPVVVALSSGASRLQELAPNAISLRPCRAQARISINPLCNNSSQSPVPCSDSSFSTKTRRIP